MTDRVLQERELCTLRSELVGKLLYEEYRKGRECQEGGTLVELINGLLILPEILDVLPELFAS